MCTPTNKVIFPIDSDVCISWCYGMATVENWMVGDESQVFEFPDQLRAANELFRGAPIGTNSQVMQTHFDIAQGTFGISNIYRHSPIIDLPDLKFHKKQIKVTIQNLPGKYAG